MIFFASIPFGCRNIQRNYYGQFPAAVAGSVQQLCRTPSQLADYMLHELNGQEKTKPSTHIIAIAWPTAKIVWHANDEKTNHATHVCVCPGVDVWQARMFFVACVHRAHEGRKYICTLISSNFMNILHNNYNNL